MNSYHNTNKESGKTLIASKRKAERQEKIVMIFAENFYGDFTAEQCWMAMFEWKNIPLTSVRRAISNLAKEKKLRDTGLMRMGSRGKMITVWALPNTSQQTTLLDNGQAQG